MKRAIVLIIVLIIGAVILIVTNRSKPAGDCYQSLKGPTFYEKVKIFWSHFQSKEKEFRDIIDRDETNKVIEMLDEPLEKMIPGIGSLVGMNSTTGNYELILSAEGDKTKRFLLEFWKKNAPELQHWKFFSSKPPSFSDLEFLTYNNRTYLPETLMLNANIVAEYYKIDVVAYHPLFKKVDEEEGITVLFLFFDIFLGEDGTDIWIGKIEISTDPLEGETIKLTELKEYIDSVIDKHKWHKPQNPLEIWSSYELKPEEKEFYKPREDVLAGSTRHINFIFDYHNPGEKSIDPLEGTGAEFVYIMIDNANFDREKMVKQRGEIEDHLADVLEKEMMGSIIGGASGINHSYIDLIIFKGNQSIENIYQLLEQRNLSPVPTVRLFKNGCIIRK